MIWTHTAAFIAGLAVAAVGTWNVQNWRYGSVVANIKRVQAEAVVKAQDAAKAVEAARIKQVQDAQYAAQKRAQTARRDADNARTELDRLRQQLAASPISDAPAACTDRAATVSQLLAECGAAYQGLARAADGHATDVRTLIQAWPK